MVGFVSKNVLSDNIGVTRGVCGNAGGHSHIIDVVVTSDIAKRTYGRTEAYGMEFTLDFYVSMNFRGFPSREGCGVQEYCV